mgnify:CR=1 FL=1
MIRLQINEPIRFGKDIFFWVQLYSFETSFDHFWLFFQNCRLDHFWLFSHNCHLVHQCPKFYWISLYLNTYMTFHYFRRRHIFFQIFQILDFFAIFFVLFCFLTKNVKNVYISRNLLKLRNSNCQWKAKWREFSNFRKIDDSLIAIGRMIEWNLYLE